MTNHPHGHGHGHGHTTEQDPAAFWEDLYGEKDQRWSGRVNASLADVVRTLAPGRAVDLGSGEGGDAIWLAQQGWTVTGVDISPTAVRRAQQAATAAGLDDARVRFVTADLSTDPGAVGAGYDLVTACFFHSPVALDRTAILRRAADLLGAGGHLLLVTHAAAPPWADPEQIAHHTFLSPADEVDELALDPAGWAVALCETRSRAATGPDGEPGTLDDGVVLVRRR
jgi:SAM-dependent methyltransferase